jgi:hypothetical protein
MLRSEIAMTDEPTPIHATDPPEIPEPPDTELASLVAALGGGPGDGRAGRHHHPVEQQPAGEDRRHAAG